MSHNEATSLFTKYSSDWFFAFIWNIAKKKSGVKIHKIGHYMWSIDNGYSLLSPTAKYTSVGLKPFSDKFEKYFKINSGDVCLDVGSCIGDTTLPMLIKTGDSGHVYAVEPDKLNIEYLELNTIKYHNFTLIPKAIWADDKGKELFMYDTLSGHSLLSKYNKKGSVKIQTDTLDKLFNGIKIDFAKIDIQGAEIDVLSMSDMFLCNVNKLVVECHYNTGLKENTKDDVITILKKHYKFVYYAGEYNTVYAWR
jgi:FkbM family methyltransferase